MSPGSCTYTVWTHKRIANIDDYSNTFIDSRLLLYLKNESPTKRLQNIFIYSILKNRTTKNTEEDCQLTTLM